MIEVRGGETIPRLIVQVAQPGEVASVTAHYGLSNAWPTSRFYREGIAKKIEDDRYAAPAPIFACDDTIYAFANVAYRSGVHLSTRLIRVAARGSGGAPAPIRWIKPPCFKRGPGLAASAALPMRSRARFQSPRRRSAARNAGRVGRRIANGARSLCGHEVFSTRPNQLPSHSETR